MTKDRKIQAWGGLALLIVVPGLYLLMGPDTFWQRLAAIVFLIVLFCILSCVVDNIAEEAAKKASEKRYHNPQSGQDIEDFKLDRRHD